MIACPLCGRLIYADHNFSDHNYEAHVEACPRQQEMLRKKKRRALARAIRRAGVGAMPLPGQLTLPYIDV